MTRSPKRSVATASSRAPRGTLNPDIIQEAALRILDREGLDALTMRRLADELAVKPMSLYSHFLSKEALLAALKERLFAKIAAELQTSAPKSDTWSDRLRHVFEVTHRVSVEHPAFVPLLIAVPRTPSSQSRYKEDLSTLIEAGFEPDEAELALRALASHLVGSLLIDYYHVMGVDAPMRGSTYFEYGLELIMDGVGLTLETSRAARLAKSERSTRGG